MRSLVTGVMLLFCVSACSSSTMSHQNHRPAGEWVVLYSSEYGGSGIEETLVFTDRETFSGFWNGTINEFSHAADVPQVDYEKEMVVVQMFESQNYGGDKYVVESAEYEGNKVFVNYKVISSGDMGTTAITNPMIILIVKKTPKPDVEFILRP